MGERLRIGKAEQERRAQQAARRADEIWSASSSQMRKAEREPREAVYRAAMLKWRIEGGGLRPRQPRSLAQVGSWFLDLVGPHKPHDEQEGCCHPQPRHSGHHAYRNAPSGVREGATIIWPLAVPKRLEVYTSLRERLGLAT
jgi:hypothetical protein